MKFKLFLSMVAVLSFPLCGSEVSIPSESSFTAGPQEQMQEEAQEASGCDKEASDKHWNSATDFIEQEKPNEALSEYEEAYRLCPDALILHDIANTYDTSLNNYNKALTYYERFLKEDTAGEDEFKKNVRTRAQEIQESQESYKRGESLYSEGKYDEAISEFWHVHDLCPHAYNLYNIGRCYEKLALRSYEEFFEHLERYPGARASISRSDEEEVKKKMSLLQSSASH